MHYLGGVIEEAGAEIEIISELGAILETRDDLEQRSHGYLARVKGETKKPGYTANEISHWFQEAIWLPIDEAIEVFKKDEPTFIQAEFMSLRDRTFLEAARDFINRQSAGSNF